MFRRVRSASQRLALIACGALLVTAGAAGCGRSGDDDRIAGKTAFIQKCGSCHTLARANTKGVQGPNLDEAFGPARAAGLGRDHRRGRGLDQIKNVRRNSTMPKNLVTGQDAKRRGRLRGRGRRPARQGRGPAGHRRTQGLQQADPGQGWCADDACRPQRRPFLRLHARRGRPARSRSRARTPPRSDHDIALKDASGKELGGGKVVSGGGVSEFSADVKPGKYEYLCTVPGHEAGGMKGT